MLWIDARRVYYFFDQKRGVYSLLTTEEGGVQKKGTFIQSITVYELFKAYIISRYAYC